MGTAEEVRTAPCVPAIRAAVQQWKASGDYPGATETTRRLLHYWFGTDHRIERKSFRYHYSQREAVETLVYLHEVAGIPSQRELFTTYIRGGQSIRFPARDAYPRQCVKMATGSGKTLVMALVAAWQYFNAVLESRDRFASTFLVIAPNVIVFERLQRDFRHGAVFQRLPIIPRDIEVHWDVECYMRGDVERAHSEGALYLTNVQQLYDRPARAPAEADPLAAVLGADPKRTAATANDFRERIARRGKVLVLNDEAHHTHEDNVWMRTIYAIDDAGGVAGQLDFTATPRFQDGTLFPWTVYDYPLRKAIDDGIVKRPMKGVVQFEPQASDDAGVRYAGHLTAAVERWREYRGQLEPSGKRPILFIMLTNTTEVDETVAWLRAKYPDEFAGEQCLPIHVNLRGDDDEGSGINQRDLAKAREFVDQVDDGTSPVNAVVSVMMLREGWDVQNVTVVVGLRPYTAKANILPEQTIGRGLRLMFRGQSGGEYRERVDIIGTKAFIDYVEDLERIEGVDFDQFDLGKDRLTITTIAPQPGRELFDIGIPELSRALQRRQDLGAIIAALDVTTLHIPRLEPLAATLGERLPFEGYDLLTHQKEIEREYLIPEVQTPQEVISFYAQEIASRVRAPGHFAPLAVKVREFFMRQAFGEVVDLDAPGYLPAIAAKPAGQATIEVFVEALRPHIIEEQVVSVQVPARSLYTTPPFPWSKPLYEAGRSVFNFEGCDNDFECTFARWLDHAPDLRAFCKLPRDFGFAIEYADVAGNLRLYYPDFTAVAADGTHWLLETKGQEDLNVSLKDQAARLWCENATALGVGRWRYQKAPQSAFERIQPSSLAELPLLTPSRLPGT